MDSLSSWGFWIIAALGLSPAFLVVGAISQSLRRTQWPRLKGASQFGPEQVRDELAIAIPSLSI
jgi:hypothetical protein